MQKTKNSTIAIETIKRQKVQLLQQKLSKDKLPRVKKYNS